MHQKKRHPIVRQIDQAMTKPEYLRFQSEFAAWFVRDMQGHPAPYRAAVKPLAERYPVIPVIYQYVRQGKTLPFLPPQHLYDLLINTLIEVAKPRMPARLKALERAAAAVLPNARRN